MNNSLGTLTLFLDGDDKSLKATLTDAKGNITELSNTADRETSKMSAGFEKLGTVIKATAIAGVVALGAAFVKTITSGFDLNNSIEQARTKIEAFTKDSKLTGDILRYVKDEAAKTQFGFEEMATSAANLIPASKQSGESLKRLIETSEILASLNPAEGLEGAAFSLREALSGDFVSIVERFNLPRQRLNQLKAEGVPAIEAIRRSLQEMGIDYSLVSKQGETTKARFDQVLDIMKQLAAQATKPLFDKVSGSLSNLAKTITDNRPSIDAFVATIGTKLSETLNFVSRTFDTLSTILRPLFDYIATQQSTLTAFGNVLQLVGVILGGTVAAAILIVVGSFAGLIFIVDTTIKFFKAFGDVLASVFIFFRDTWTSIVSIYSAVAQFFRDVFTSAAQAVIISFSGINSFFNGILNFIRSIFSGIGGFFGSVFGDAYSRITSVFGNLAGFFTNLVGSIQSAGKNIVDGLVKGISNGKDAVVNKIKDICSGALDEVKKFFGIHSPSTVMDKQVGQMITRGLANGLDTGAANVLASMDAINRQIFGSVDTQFATPIGINYSANSIPNINSDDMFAKSSSGNNQPIVQNVYPTNEVDASIISRELMREARRS